MTAWSRLNRDKSDRALCFGGRLTSCRASKASADHLKSSLVNLLLISLTCTTMTSMLGMASRLEDGVSSSIQYKFSRSPRIDFEASAELRDFISTGLSHLHQYLSLRKPLSNSGEDDELSGSSLHSHLPMRAIKSNRKQLKMEAILAPITAIRSGHFLHCPLAFSPGQVNPRQKRC